MAKAMRHRKPCTQPYFSACYKTDRDGSIRQEVYFYDPTCLEISLLWAEEYDPDYEGPAGAWGEFLAVEPAVRLAQAMARRLGLWDGHTARDWTLIARLLLSGMSDDWSLSRPDLIHFWRDFHGQKPVTPTPF
jgi:hypothetical protein